MKEPMFFNTLLKPWVCSTVKFNKNCRQKQGYGTQVKDSTLKKLYSIKYYTDIENVMTKSRMSRYQMACSDNNRKSMTLYFRADQVLPSYSYLEGFLSVKKG